MEIKIIDQIQQTAKEVEEQLPVLKAVNPIQSTIIGETLSRIKSLSPEYCDLSYNDLIAKYKLGLKNEQSVKLVYNGFLRFSALI